jgi:hypothetical protein
MLITFPTVMTFTYVLHQKHSISLSNYNRLHLLKLSSVSMDLILKLGRKQRGQPIQTLVYLDA